MSSQPIRVLKFGSSVLASRRDLAAVVHAIYREVRDGHRVVAVVSALAGVTDRLLANTRRFGAAPDPSKVALYLATGETQSVALLALALERTGVSVEALDPERIGLVAEGELEDARPVAVDAAALLASLAAHSVVVVPGFYARTRDRRVALFGRGGSDLTALYLSQQLPDATAKLVKDVDGIFEHDPAARAADNLRYDEIPFDEALRVAGRVVQPKALSFAREHGLRFEVGALDSPTRGTRVGADRASFAWPAAPRRALRVTLLGLGTVGLGVYRELARRPELFQVRHILVRRARGRTQARVPQSLLTTRLPSNAFDDTDVVVELLGGEEPARALVAQALSRGIDVVSANKALFAEHGAELAAIAARAGAVIRHSAAVGGAVPMLETVRTLGERVRSFEGVVNSTTNVVLDRLGEGSTLEAAVGLAHEHGYCEANPWVDLSGDDAAHKLVLLARAAFGADVVLEWAERRGIADLDPAEVRATRARGASTRLVGTCTREGARVVARLAPRIVEPGDALAGVRDESNLLAIETTDGRRIVLTGKGAGRWPTTESVLADLFELSRTRARRATRANATAVAAVGGAA
jgi:homoserine dehydrogenase